MSNKYYTCRIDTNQYSGNFEREMVAFITAHIGQCGVGQKNAKIAIKELTTITFDWFVEYVISTPDEHGCRRPAEIVPTPGWSNDGRGNNFHNTEHLFAAYQSVQMRFEIEPPENIKTLINERANKFMTLHKVKNLLIDNIEFFKVEIQTITTSLGH